MLARENSCRNPARTAVTAGALTVGLALVAFVATLGAGLRGTINDTVRQQVHADYVISADTATLSPTVAAILQRQGGVTATGIRQGQTSTFGNTEQINGVDPATIARFYHFKWQSGSGAGALAALGMTGSIVSNQFATDHHLQVGDSFAVQTESGTRLELVVRGIQSTPTFGSLLGAVTINTALFDRSFTQPADHVVLADTGGVSPAAEQRLTSALAGFPDAKIRTVPAYINTAQASVNTLLNLLYVLLALSVIVSLFGIVNTLALSIVERTREIGALRAIGMTRRQLKRMIKIESELTAMIGATLGIVVGLVLAALATAALATWSLTFSVPWATLLVLAIIALFAGRIAGGLPARRASRLDPLQALHYE